MTSSAEDSPNGGIEPWLLRCTLLMLLLYGPSDYYVEPVLTALSGIMLLSPRFMNMAALWALLAVGMSHGLVLRWFDIDNHKFLMTYWTWSVYIAVRFPDMANRVPDVARLLLGLTFLFASFWKIVGREYGDGSFWEFELLSSFRILGAAQLLGGLTDDLVRVNARQLMDLQDPTGDIRVVTLLSSSRLHAAARMISVAGLLMEVLIACLYLAPLSATRPVQMVRTGVILGFLLVYAVVPVVGFAWIIAVLAAASLPGRGMGRQRGALVAMAFGLTATRGIVAWAFSTVSI